MKYFFFMAAATIIICCSQKNVSTIDYQETKTVKGTNRYTKDTTIQVSKTETFEISLEAILSTGFIWELKETVDSTYLKFRNRKEVIKTNLEGTGSLLKFKFEPLKKGKTEVLFWYIRPWKKDNATNPNTEIIRYEVEIM